MMNAEVQDAIRHLLATERVLAVAVLVEGEPEAGLLPFAPSDDSRILYVQASGLARHTRGLQPGARVSVLVHASDAPDRDPMQLTRLTVQATVEMLEKDTEAHAAGRLRLVARFPAAGMTLQLGDFNLYALRLGRGRYVEGFARAVKVNLGT
jgi:putative heme iron utilization protein